MSIVEAPQEEAAVLSIDLRDPLASFTSAASKPAEDLARRIRSREAIVGVIGLGYVGLPLAVGYAEAGFRVVGFDVDANRVGMLRDGRSPVEDIPDERLAPLVAAMHSLYLPRVDGDRGCLTVTSDFDVMSVVDAVIICVPTPLGHTKDPDMSYILSATEEIARRLRSGMLVVLESTTYPGTTEEVVLPILSAPVTNDHRGHGTPPAHAPRVVGRDFFLAFSPERIDPGRTDYTIHNTPKVIGGVTPTCLALSRALYDTVVERTVPVSQPKAAELVKLLENTFRSVNIGLVNELALWCDKLGVDVWEVIDAAATKPFGFMRFLPGPGLGGHCIPIDPHYLAWKLRTLDHGARFIQLADEVNMAMPRYVFNKLTLALNEQSKSVRGAKVLVLGVAYKPNVSDMRESPAISLVEQLIDHGADISYCDPHVPVFRVGNHRFEASLLEESVLRDADCVVVETDHAEFDWNLIVTAARSIVDARNGTAKATVPATARIFKL